MTPELRINLDFAKSKIPAFARWGIEFHLTLFLVIASVISILLIEIHDYVIRRSNPNIGEVGPKSYESWRNKFSIYVVGYFSFVVFSFLSLAFLHHVWDVSTEGSYLYWQDTVENFKVFPLLAKFHEILDYCPAGYLARFVGPLAEDLRKYKAGYEKMRPVVAYAFRRSLHVCNKNMFEEWLEECPYSYADAMLFCRTEPEHRTGPLLTPLEFIKFWQETVFKSSTPGELVFFAEYCRAWYLVRLFFPEIPAGGFPGGVSVLEYYQGLASRLVTVKDFEEFLKNTPRQMIPWLKYKNLNAEALDALLAHYKSRLPEEKSRPWWWWW